MMHRVHVQVVGYIWQPGFGPCATDYTLRCSDILNRFDRETVQSWLDANAGDFQEVIDFRATHGPEEIDWANLDNECTYNACMEGE